MSHGNFKCLRQGEETGKGLEPFTQIMQEPEDMFTDFLQRLTLGIEKNVSDPIVRKELIESLAFENANSGCK